MMKNRWMIAVLIGFSLSAVSCEIFLLEALRTTTQDKMNKYLVADGGVWEIESVHKYVGERGHTSEEYVTTVDSLWQPGGSIELIKKKWNSDDRYAKGVYTDGNGNTQDIEWGLFDDDFEDDDPKLSFYTWDNFPFPKTHGGFWLDYWENDHLTLLNRNAGQDTYTKERLTIELKRVQ